MTTATTSRARLDPDALVRECLRRGATPAEIAAIAGVSRQAVAKVLRGDPVRSDAAARLLTTLEAMEPLRGAAALLARRSGD